MDRLDKKLIPFPLPPFSKFGTVGRLVGRPAPHPSIASYQRTPFHQLKSLYSLEFKVGRFVIYLDCHSACPTYLNIHMGKIPHIHVLICVLYLGMAVGTDNGMPSTPSLFKNLTPCSLLVSITSPDSSFIMGIQIPTDICKFTQTKIIKSKKEKKKS